MSSYNGDILVERIRKICRKKGMSIAQMEKDLKWSQGLISRWTKNSPSIGKVMDVVHYLDISYEELLGDLDSEESILVEQESFSQKLYNVTMMGKLEWYIWNGQFQNEDVQALIENEEKNIVYYTSFEKCFFLLVVNKEYEGSMKVGVLYTERGKIKYQDQDTEEWMEALLAEIDQSEYELWLDIKTQYYMEQFMRTDFNISK